MNTLGSRPPRTSGYGRASGPGLRSGAVRHAALGVCMAVAILGAGTARAYEHRQSTPSFGVQGGLGRLLGNQIYHVHWTNTGEGHPIGPVDYKISDIADWGPSIDIGVRFVLDRNHALGFGFDDLRYRRKGGYTVSESDSLPEWVKFTTFHADYFLYFHRRQKVSYYLAPFIGFQQQEFRYKIGALHSQTPEVLSGEYRFLYGVSVGLEYFIRRSFSIDGGLRNFILSEKKGTSVAVQPVLGIQIYVI